MTRFLVALLAFLLAAPPSTALAQQAAAPAQAAPPADTWVLTRLREGDTLLATAPFSNGITVVARCAYNNFDLILAGLPEPADASAAWRQLIVLVGDDATERSTSWSVATDRTGAFSRLPGPTARRLARGGQLQIIIPAPPGGRRTRYVMNLTQSVSAVQQVMAHCGRPLVDPNDDRLEGDGGDGLPGSLVWVRPPRPYFPGANVHGRPLGGTVTLSCDVTTEGRLTRCDVENEFPSGFGFGVAALRAVGNARVALDDEARAAGRVLAGDDRTAFTIAFRLAD